MYNFESQKKMLSVSLALLEEKGIKNISAIGGGTALAAYYCEHSFLIVHLHKIIFFMIKSQKI